ncbi:MAG: hypothetical protein ACNYPD_01320 [Candidatus Halichondribacter symbioticus]
MAVDIRESSNLRLVIHFDIEEPIGLNELARSFNAMADLYKTALPRSAKGKAKKEDVELYITEIKDNCILIKILSILNETGDLDANIERIAIFTKLGKKISLTTAFLMGAAVGGSVPESDSSPTIYDTNIAASIAEAIAEKEGGGLELYIEENADGSKKIIFKMSQDEAQKVIEGKRIVDEARNKTSTENYNNVLLRFIPARIGNSKGRSQTGLRGIIKTLSKDSLPVYMVKEIKNEVANSMDNEKGNPFKVDYLVDVIVTKNKDGKIESYEITEWNKIVPPTDSPK